MMNDIISALLQAPLFVQVLILILIVLVFAALIILCIFHERIGVESMWIFKFTPTKIKKQLEESKNTINNLNQEIERLKLPAIVGLPPLPGRYLIGIDIGRDKIDFCLVDYKRFAKKEFSKVKVIEGTKPTPDHFRDIYPELVGIVRTLSEDAWDKDIKSIDGIGLGLPGQVDPRQGLLLKCPGFESINNELLVKRFRDCMADRLSDSLKYHNILDAGFPIEIDNDVRCATRYVWKRHLFEDVICIFVGMGLGSGIVLGGKMLYGCNFAAGEIGHTTISESCEFLKGQKCKCDKNGYHWEMYATSSGMMNIAQKLDPKEYERLKTDYKEIIKENTGYAKLLDTEEFRKYKEKHFDDKGELTTYFLSLAFYAGEEYAAKVVKEFIRYLAIGIANYLNVINPQKVYLGGGMIRGFYDNKYKSPFLENHTTEYLLQSEKDKYALPCASQVTIMKQDYEETRIASMGAALILKDQSYFDYKNK